MYTSEAVADLVKGFDRTQLSPTKTADSSGADLKRQKVKVDIEKFNRWCLANVEVKPPTPTIQTELRAFDQHSLKKTQTAENVIFTFAAPLKILLNAVLC